MTPEQVEQLVKSLESKLEDMQKRLEILWYEFNSVSQNGSTRDLDAYGNSSEFHMRKEEEIAETEEKIEALEEKIENSVLHGVSYIATKP